MIWGRGRYLIAWRGGILLRGVFERRNCGGEAGDVGLRADGCAILGAGGGVGGRIGFVGDDSVSWTRAAGQKKNQVSVNSNARASWGAAGCAPTRKVTVLGRE